MNHHTSKRSGDNIKACMSWLFNYKQILTQLILKRGLGPIPLTWHFIWKYGKLISSLAQMGVNYSSIYKQELFSNNLRNQCGRCV